MEFISKDYVDGKTAIPEKVDIIKCRECAGWKKNKDIPGAGKCVRFNSITRGGFFCAAGSTEIPKLQPTELDFSGIFGTGGGADGG